MTGKRRDYLTSYTEDENGCWNYTGTINANGYGSILQTVAHRYFYMALVGEIPAGLQLDHLCMNKRCVNVKHLEPVTHLENMRRRSAAQTHCLRGHAFEGDNIIWTISGEHKRRGCRACSTARKYSIADQRMQAGEYKRLPARMTADRVPTGTARVTHCPAGHEYAGANLHVNTKGQRICRACPREKARALALLKAKASA